jgi:RNA polymerase sigma-70 factor (ECF subfamily)
MSAPKNLADLARRFDADRRHLWSVALQLLGSASDADDAVQSAWLKASRADFGSVDNLTGWFTTITAREALDQLRASKRRAEQPLATPDELDRMAATASASADEEALLTESVSNALLVVLDRLSPAQRVAFVLHDVFAVPFEVIAGLLALLAPDVVRRVDRALVPDDVPTELGGARQVAEETRRFALRARAGAVMLIDGAPGIVIAPHGHAQALLLIAVGADDRIHAIDIIGDAGRIRRAVLALPSWPIQPHHTSIGYQGHQKPPAGRPAPGRERKHHAR